MAWISVHTGIDGPKLRELRKNLKCSKYEATGILVYFWFWGLENAQKDGLILNADKEDIAECFIGIGAGTRTVMNDIVKILTENSFVNGELSGKILSVLKRSGLVVTPDMVVDALLETGWIDDTPRGYVIHDWEIWQEQWYKAKARRENDARRKREARTHITDNAISDNPPHEDVSVSDVTDDNVEKTTKKKSSRSDNYGEGFEEFWSVYPRKVGKSEAYKKYVTRRKDGFSEEDLYNAAKNYAAECKRLNTEAMYIKHPRTFLSDNTPFIDFLKKENPAPSDFTSDTSNPYEEWGN